MELRNYASPLSRHTDRAARVKAGIPPPGSFSLPSLEQLRAEYRVSDAAPSDGIAAMLARTPEPAKPAARRAASPVFTPVAAASAGKRRGAAPEPATDAQGKKVPAYMQATLSSAAREEGQGSPSWATLRLGVQSFMSERAEPHPKPRPASAGPARRPASAGPARGRGTAAKSEEEPARRPRPQSAGPQRKARPRSAQ